SDPPTPAPYTLSLHDALPIFDSFWEIRQPRLHSFRYVHKNGWDWDGILTVVRVSPKSEQIEPADAATGIDDKGRGSLWLAYDIRSEEHTSELQSRSDLVCRLL